jgi:hypothetical protein
MLQARPKQEKKGKLDSFIEKNRYFLISYVDGIIRSLLAFVFLLPFYHFILSGFFNLEFIFAFPILIIVSIFISPFLSKVNVGYIVVDKYEEFLNR